MLLHALGRVGENPESRARILCMHDVEEPAE